MKYVSLFAGIGGFDLALNRLGHECVYVNEWDKYAAQIYEKNFKHKPDTRDIAAVRAEEIPDHDLLVGGFPCQSFSIAGKRGGFNDTRGTLFFEIARILSAKRPKLFLLENVKGLLSHDGGRTFSTIISTLDELGYDLQWQVLNSKNFGVPQNRERVFIVGYTRGESRLKVFPLIGDDSENNEAGQKVDMVYWKNSKEKWVDEQKKVSPTLKTHTDLVKRPLIKRLDTDSAHYQDRVYGTDGISPTLPTGTGGNHQPKILAPAPRYGNGERKISYSERDVSPAIKATQHKRGDNEPFVSQGVSIRRLTPVECERLQGFPDGWTEGVSDTQRYKQLGNAVTVNVVYELVKRLLN